MKIGYSKDYKRVFTLADMENAKRFEAAHKTASDDGKIDFKWEIEAAINEAIGNEIIVKVFEYKAEFAKNCRAWNIYKDTQDMDVWLTATAKTTAGFIEIGAYLSDTWKIGGEEVKHHFYIVNYKAG